MLTRREAVKGLGAAMAGLLIPQDYQLPGDLKGKRKKVRPEDIRSGTLYGQYQLRGSVLTIKDASTTASGYMAFGTDMTTIPTSATAGTGIYIDYTGIYGLSSGTQQAYMRASDGKIIAGAGAVTLDVNGITIVKGTSSEEVLKWADSVNGQRMFELYGDDDGTFQQGYISGLGTSNITSGEMIVRAKDYEGDRELTFKLFADTPNTRTYANLIGTATFVGFLISGTEGVPSSLLHLKSTAPTFRMEDSTASAKSLLVTVDGNYATFEEVGGNDLLKLDLANLSVILGNAALATTATDGFLYVAACAGVPTGAPTAVTGRVPVVVDSTNNKMYIYSSGAWVALN